MSHAGFLVIVEQLFRLDIYIVKAGGRTAPCVHLGGVASGRILDAKTKTDGLLLSHDKQPL